MINGYSLITDPQNNSPLNLITAIDEKEIKAEKNGKRNECLYDHIMSVFIKITSLLLHKRT